MPCKLEKGTLQASQSLSVGQVQTNWPRHMDLEPAMVIQRHGKFQAN